MHRRFQADGWVVLLRTAGLAGLLAMAACSTGPGMQSSDFASEDAPDSPDGPGLYRDAAGVPRIDDPAEPFNRAMSGVNHGLIVGLLNPACHGWRWVTGPSFREAFGRCLLNLRWPVRLFGNLLQAEWRDAGRETSRFCINLTIGLLGFFDPAKERFGLEATEEDVGRAFAAWGWEHSDYLVLPFFGPRTNRDALALPFDLALNPLTYLAGAGVIETINNGTDKIDAYFRFVETSYDPYQRGRYAYMLDREWSAVSYEAISSHDRSVETLGAAYLSFEDPEFPREVDERSVHVDHSGRDFTYDLWLQDGPAPLVFVLPGLGGHRRGGSALGLAEMVHRAGCSAVTISNAMNWEFVRDGASVDVPGFAPADARDVHRVLGTILTDIEAEYPGRVTQRGLLGISLGAFHTLFIAASEDSDVARYPRFDAYVAINPPVRLAVGLDRLDAFHDVTMDMAPQQRREWVDTLIGKVLGVVRDGSKSSGEMLSAVESETESRADELPFRPKEAQFLIGMAFRAVLNEIIISSQDRKDLGILKSPLDEWRRAAVFDEALGYSFERYLNDFALRYWSERDPALTSSAQLLEPCDVRRFEERLHADPRVLVFTNANDFLLDPSDLAWLQQTFGPERLRVSPSGGHLGNLYEAGVQESIVERLMKRLADAGVEAEPAAATEAPPR